ncbi:amidohydrolase family protein [Schnuerera sp. xch1]|uniref:amidohydrolase family protein n=1 Tax=Schnuerera sp. xch1 TaxID=2874283 RepID=UPI001CBD73A4|nr:amidohydrolase family protein [Schnuerera sp. xch1]MBZ2175148.1 amidohydrolase family protein [Schnuerera sp. xch1]
MKKVIFKGDIVFTPTKDKFQVHKDSYLISENGKVVKILKQLGNEYNDYSIKDFTDKLIIPGFIDLHLHAPQYNNIGLGLDKELIPWLNTCTFPEEAKFYNVEYAKKTYKQLIRDLWRYGTTSAVIYSSIHKDSTKLLMDLFIDSNMRGYIGKVNMNRNAIPELLEDTKISIEETEEIIFEYKDKSSLVKPIITPRFVPSCTEELMEGLGQLALKYDIPVQSHLSENMSEVKWVKELHPGLPNYSSVYNQYNLFGQTKTIMAHCIYNTEDELELMAKNQVYAAHCVYSNYNLSSGIMPVREFLDREIPVGLGSDISGGNSLSIPSIMCGTVQASKIKWIETNKRLKPLTSSEVFYLGTKGGGSFFGNVGSFEKGYELDCLIIDDSNICDVDKLTLQDRIQKFIYTGDDRNIIERYIHGEKVHKPL